MSRQRCGVARFFAVSRLTQMLSLHINSFNVFGWIDELASIRMLFNWKLVSIHSNCISLCSTLPGGCLAERWSTLNDQSTLTKVALIARKHVSDFYLGSHMKPVCSTTKEGFEWTRESLFTRYNWHPSIHQALNQWHNWTHPNYSLARFSFPVYGLDTRLIPDQ